MGLLYLLTIRSALQVGHIDEVCRAMATPASTRQPWSSKVHVPTTSQGALGTSLLDPAAHGLAGRGGTADAGACMLVLEDGKF